MNARQLLAKISNHWPEQVDVAQRERNSSGDFWFPKLAQINHEVEDKIDYDEVGDWSNIAAWSFYQAVTEYARELAEIDVHRLTISDVPMGIFDKWVRFNLDGSDWSAQRNEYTGIG